ncbi:MAG TPA: hypothetical protein VFE54_09070 [Mucilaginibacter sp.]|jgi:hypothetical protein|nr:hypothetical protein [Mucilaginibacter sp.]
MTNKRLFTSSKALEVLIAQYFDLTDCEDQPEKCGKKISVRKTKSTDEKVRLHEPGFPTFNGLAHYLGFVSLDEFEEYEGRPRFSAPLKRARLRIAAIYEKKLHTHSYGGAAVALKICSQGEKTSNNVADTGDNNQHKVEIIHSGIVPAAYEKDVVM